MMGKMSMAALLGATLVFVGTVSQPAGESTERRANELRIWEKSFFLPKNRWNFFIFEILRH